ncbi:hypothetical protein N9Y42_01160 [Mariniblastus sp.]|nr:hypothetical protein [Mariniblastus sp.]
MLPATLCAHVYEDGFVERSLKITIRDGVGYGEYHIGLNEKTADQILKVAEQLEQEKLQLELMNKQSTATGQHDHSKTSQSASPMKAHETSQIDLPNKAVEPDKATKLKANAKIDLSLKPSAVPLKQPFVGSGGHLTDLATIKRFGDLHSHWFADRLKILSDGELVELTNVSVEPASRHPYSVLVKFQFSLDKKKVVNGSPNVKQSSVEQKSDSLANEVVDFELTDRLFEQNQGAARYALRARGTTMLLRSNVAPALVRADRVEIAQKAAITKETLPAIKAKLTVGGR